MPKINIHVLIKSHPASINVALVFISTVVFGIPTPEVVCPDVWLSQNEASDVEEPTPVSPPVWRPEPTKELE